MVGSPGAGKTLRARALPGILPEMSTDESLDVTKISSIADQLPPGTPLIRHRAFQSPHHTISHAGLVGGGNIPHPGKIPLAHRGVLLLDEFPELSSRVLEVMRQPMEDKVVTISRAQLADVFGSTPTGGRNEPLPVWITNKAAWRSRGHGCVPPERPNAGRAALPGPGLPGYYAVGPQFCDGASVFELSCFKEQTRRRFPWGSGRPVRLADRVRRAALTFWSTWRRECQLRPFAQTGFATEYSS